jgi:hypothetical protein
MTLPKIGTLLVIGTLVVIATLPVLGGGGGGGGGGGTCNYYMSATGSDSNNGTSSGTPFLTASKAYQTASSGQTVCIENGALTSSSLTIPWDSSKTSTNCDGWVDMSANPTPITSGCVTFTPDTGATPSCFNDGASPSTTASWSIEGNDVRLLNFNCGSGSLGGGIDISNCVAGQQPAYIVIDGFTGGRGRSGAGLDGGFHLGGYIHNIGILNSTFNWDVGASADNYAGAHGQINPCGSGTGTNISTNPVMPYDIRLQNDVFENQYQVGTHNACIHVTDAGKQAPNGISGLDHLILERVKLLNCAGNGIEIQPRGYHDVTIENSIFAAVCSGQSQSSPGPAGGTCQVEGDVINLGGDYPDTSNQCYTNDTVRFNTSVGGEVKYDVTLCDSVGTQPHSGQTVNDYGNVWGNGSGYTSFRCGLTTGAPSWINMHDEVWSTSGANCGTNSQQADNQLVDGTSPTYNFHLANCAVVAANMLSTSVSGGYPPIDYSGNTRPAGTNLDAGAFEDCS